MKCLVLCMCVGVFCASAKTTEAPQDEQNPLFAIRLKGVTVADFATYPFFGANVLGILTSQIDAAIEVKCTLSDIRPCPDDDTATLLGFSGDGKVVPDEKIWKDVISDKDILPDVEFGVKIAFVDRQFYSYDANVDVKPPKEVPIEETFEEKVEKALKQRKKYMKLRLKSHSYEKIVQKYEELGQLTAIVRQTASKVLSVPENSVFILDVLEGSVVVAFTAYSEEDEIQDGTGTESTKHAERWQRAIQEENEIIKTAFEDADFQHEAVVSEDEATEPPVSENSTVIIEPDDEKGHMNVSAIIGGIAGGLMILAVVGVVIYFLLKKKAPEKNKNTKDKLTISRLPSDSLTPVGNTVMSPGGLKEVNVDTK